MPIAITCPSGLAGDARGLTVRDGRFMTDRTVTRQGIVADRILDACWLSTRDPGIYDVAPGAKIPWGKVLVGDRDYALMQIRIASWGDVYEFQAQCQACEATFGWELNLAELRVQELPAQSRERFRSGEPFVATLPGLPPIKFRLPTGEDALRQRQRAKQRSRDGANLLLESVEMRIIEIEGVQRGQPVRDLLEGLEMRQLRNLLDEFDRHDGGIDTSIEIECTECRRVQAVDLPFDGGFFFPRTPRWKQKHAGQSATP